MKLKTIKDEYGNPLKLNNLQRKHADAVKWMLDQDIRASGKSTLQLIVAINLAMKKPGTWIYIQDHMPGGAIRAIMLRRLEGMLKTNTELGRFKLNKRDAVLRYLGPPKKEKK